MSGVRRLVSGPGLYTDPSALTCPPGSLRTADDVSLHRPGTIQPRPGFGDTTGIASRSVTRRPIGIYPHGASAAVLSYESGTPDVYTLERLDTTATYSALVTPPDVTIRGRADSITARGSLYLTSSTGLRKLTGVGATLTRAGGWQTYQPPVVALTSTGGAGTEIQAVDPDSIVAYRWCSKRTDANGYVIRSAPSPRFLARCAAATYANGAYVTMTDLELPTEAIAGDVLELYRTTNSGSLTVDPGEDYYLCDTYTLTAGDITTGNVSPWVDKVLDESLAASLYTSQSQLGALASKEVPPIANHLAWWGRCAWAAHTTERSVLSCSLTQVAFEGAAAVRLEGPGLCTVGAGAYTGVSGNALTGVTFAAYAPALGWSSLVAGMWIADNVPEVGGSIQAGSRIVSWNSGAGTITLDKAPSGARAFKCGDIVKVAGLEFFAYDAESAAAMSFRVDLDSADNDDRCATTARSLARMVSRYAAGTDTGAAIYKDEVLVSQTGEFVVIAQRPENSAVTLLCSTRGGAFAPDISTQITAPTGARASRLHYSSPDEPEAWPPASYLHIGDGREEAAILALVPLADAMLVWTDAGLYAVTGSAPDQWVVDTVDVSIRLLSAHCTAVLDGICYAWTDRGVVAASSQGVEVVSAQIGNVLRAYQAVLPRGSDGHKRGAWMTAHPRIGLVFLAAPATRTDEFCVQKWVFHARTGGAWSIWRRSDRCEAYDTSEDRMLVSPYVAGWRCLYERSDESAAASYRDVSVSSLTATITGVTVVIASSAFSPWTPAAGDVLVDGSSVARRVTAIIEQGGNHSFTVDSTGQATGNSWTWHQGYAATVEWQAQHLPGLASRWEEMHLALERDGSQYVASYPMLVGGQSGIQTSATTTTATITPANGAARVLRVGPPREIVRAAHLYPRISVTCAGAFWRASEMQLHATMQSRRVAR